MAAPLIEGAAVTALRSVLHRVQRAAERSGRRPEQVRVVAVGKTKPTSLIRHVYDAGHRCFGENYVQEFIEKAPQGLVKVCSFFRVATIYTRVKIRGSADIRVGFDDLVSVISDLDKMPK
ncbi:hypothetical protein COCNU_scaffold005445G000010 [Cocos nucifera]|nr:hypothetical protein [Cocos nucifera]